MTTVPGEVFFNSFFSSLANEAQVKSALNSLFNIESLPGISSSLFSLEWTSNESLFKERFLKLYEKVLLTQANTLSQCAVSNFSTLSPQCNRILLDGFYFPRFKLAGKIDQIGPFSAIMMIQGFPDVIVSLSEEYV
jgi:hypothetical protein